MNEITLLLGIIIVLIVGVGFIVYSFNQKVTKLADPDQNNSSSLLIQNQLNSIVNNLDSKLGETNRIVQEQLNMSNHRLQQQNVSNNELLRKINENNNKILQEVSEKLVKVEDTNKQVVNFAEQLHSLESVLKNPKQRGILGEYFLETILSNVLPKSIYKIQYSFHDGVIVDAVIFSKDKVIPIDAKFSLEGYSRILECKDKETMKVLEKNFIRDIKSRIDEVSKYVKPEENTIDIAFMFIPSDSVYQEVMKIGYEAGSLTDIVGYAYAKKVIMVSPTSFFAYLQTLLKALNTLQVEEKVTEIIKYLNESTKYLHQFEENMNKLGKNITTLNNSFNNANTEAVKLSKRIAKITNNQDNILNLEKVQEFDE